MPSRLTALLLTLPLALAALGVNGRGAQAAGTIPAGLDITNARPYHGKGSALLIGKSFVPRERVHVSYQVTVPSVSKRTYGFDVATDSFGAFKRHLQFSLGKPSYGYTLKVTATGAAGDRAVFNTWASGRGQ